MMAHGNGSSKTPTANNMALASNGLPQWLRPDWLRTIDYKAEVSGGLLYIWHKDSPEFRMQFEYSRGADAFHANFNPFKDKCDNYQRHIDKLCGEHGFDVQVKDGQVIIAQPDYGIERRYKTDGSANLFVEVQSIRREAEAVLRERQELLQKLIRTRGVTSQDGKRNSDTTTVIIKLPGSNEPIHIIKHVPNDRINKAGLALIKESLIKLGVMEAPAPMAADPEPVPADTNSAPAVANGATIVPGDDDENFPMDLSRLAETSAPANGSAIMPNTTNYADANFALEGETAPRVPVAAAATSLSDVTAASAPVAAVPPAAPAPSPAAAPETAPTTPSHEDTLGYKISHHRAQRGMNEEQLAQSVRKSAEERPDINASTVRSWEHNETVPSEAIFEALVKILIHANEKLSDKKAAEQEFRAAYRDAKAKTSDRFAKLLWKYREDEKYGVEVAAAKLAQQLNQSLTPDVTESPEEITWKLMHAVQHDRHHPSPGMLQGIIRAFDSPPLTREETDEILTLYANKPVSSIMGMKTRPADSPKLAGGATPTKPTETSEAIIQCRAALLDWFQKNGGMSIAKLNELAKLHPNITSATISASRRPYSISVEKLRSTKLGVMKVLQDHGLAQEKITDFLKLFDNLIAAEKAQKVQRAAAI